MNRRITSLLAGLAAVPAFAADSKISPDDWAQWRGPAATGFSATAKPPTTWSETQNVKWKIKIPGFGTSTPIVLGNRVFVLTAISTQPAAASAPAAPAANPAPQANPPSAPPAPQATRPEPPAGGGVADGPGGGGRRRGGGGGGGGRSEAPKAPYQFVVLCIDRNSGKTLWQSVATEEIPHEGHHRDHGFASASPITDGEHLYVSFGSRGIFCFDLNGKQVWKKDLGDMQTRNSFGEGASPAVHGDTLVINWDHEGEDFIVALNKRTGEERWRQKRDEATTWSTPLFVEHEGKVQVVVSATNRIRSYDVATGAQLWECAGMTGNVIPSPFVSDGILYAISGFRGASLLAIKLGRTGVLTGTDAIAWSHSKNTPYVPSALLYGQRLYFCSGNNGMLSALDAKTGKPYFEAVRIPELIAGVYASPVGADGRVYLVGRDGKTVVIKKDTDQLEVLATNKLDDKIDASPAISGKQMFLRGHEWLYCVEG
jgi:outer membrane protein assembly factor BamB